MFLLKLVIFAGITGFNKSEFIENFIKKALALNGLPTDLNNAESQKLIQYIKFENELLSVTDSVDIPTFLKKPSLTEKIQGFERTFQKIGDQIENSESQYIFLNIHLSYLSHSQFFPPIYGANFNELDDPISNTQICVVTLIDDVFNIWNNLKKREEEFPGTSLRLREILAWRSIEQLQAESVAFHYTTEGRHVRNYLFAVRHPFSSLYNLVFSDEPISLYLSYPITGTRTHPERVAEINAFRQRMHKMGLDLGIAVFDPVTIDELALRSTRTEKSNKVLLSENRWPIEHNTLVREPDWPISIPVNEVEEAQHDILNNVRPRDFKLVDSAIFTTIYKKNYWGLSQGVLEESRYATARGKRVYAFDPVNDTVGKAQHPFDADEIPFTDLETFYSEIEKGIKAYRARKRR